MSTLKYYQPARNWEEALPIGNGFMGGMVYGDTIRERIQINEDSVWTSGVKDRLSKDSLENLTKIRKQLFKGNISEAEILTKQSMYAKYPHMAHYQTLGDIWIDYFHRDSKYINTVDEMGIKRIEKSSIENSEYVRTLNLNDAVGKINYTHKGIKYNNEYFASNPGNFIAYKIESEKNDLTMAISLARRDDRSGRGASYLDEYDVDNQFLTLSGKTSGARGIKFLLKVKVVSTGGKQFRRGGNLIIEDAKEVVLYISARTDYRTKNIATYCEDKLEGLSIENYEASKLTHIKDYQSLFNQNTLALLDEKENIDLSTPELMARHKDKEIMPTLLQLYFDYGHYLLIASSRVGSLPANLQGIWNREFQPPWGSKYTININIQMNYWFAEKSGLGQLHLPLLEHLKNMVKNGRSVAKEMYGCRGFCSHHNTDIWGDSGPQDQSVGATIWPMGGAWLALHLLEHFEYSQDYLFLDEYFSVYQEAVLFFTDYMVQNNLGQWVTGPSVSPENLYMTENNEVGSITMGPTMDIEIIRELFSGYLYLTQFKQNEITEEITDSVNKILNNLPPLKIGKKGQIQEWIEDYDEVEEGHRHISQLFALYPGKSIDVEKTPELAQAAETTIKRRLSSGGAHTGWSKAWIINFWAQLNNGEEAFKNLNELITDSTQPNLLDSHPPFQIDGNFGAVNGMYEMLIRDKGDTVHLLPAITDYFPSGSLKNYRLKKGGLISFSWKDGKITWYKITTKVKDIEISFNNSREVYSNINGIIEYKGEEFYEL